MNTYILTDGLTVMASARMSTDDAILANKKAHFATDGNWTWELQSIVNDHLPDNEFYKQISRDEAIGKTES